MSKKNAPLLCDIEVMQSFENFFFFEFSVRNTLLKQEDQYNELLKVKDKIIEEYNKLSSDKDIKESIYLIDVEDFVSLIFHFIQFDYKFEEVLVKFIDISEFSDCFVEKIKVICNKFRKEYSLNIENSQYYSLDNISNKNNIMDVLNYWIETNNKNIREKYSLEGKIGRSGKAGNNITTYSFNFRHPDIIIFRRNNYAVFNSNCDDIIINEKNIKNSLLLNISINQSAANLDSILEEFRALFCLSQAEMDYDQILLGKTPSFEIPETLPSIEEIIKRKYNNNTLIKRCDSIYKNLIGLYCWDIIKVDKRNIDDAVNSAMDMISTHDNGQPLEYETIKAYYNYVRKDIDNIQELLETKVKLR